jgi:hypothetical protein
MFLDTQNLILLIVFLIIGVVLIICCIYCCACKPGCVNARRGIVRKQIIRDQEIIDEERTASQAQLQDTLSAQIVRLN